jgi:hypothetical protein
VDTVVVLSLAVVLLTALCAWFASQWHKGRSETDRLRQDLAAMDVQLEQAKVELTSLSGLLPMCAWCKKIRDDAGYWQQLEGYLQTHAGAEFSHSVCPECFELAQADMPDARWRI